ncbi:hypothetical protein, partial [Klebsiella aerogenes]|uniref:hypothetical protein n=1 Tax=Klebsiella aerogenes TaxID=548 RepID=UPI001954985E
RLGEYHRISHGIRVPYSRRPGQQQQRLRQHRRLILKYFNKYSCNSASNLARVGSAIAAVLE